MVASPEQPGEFSPPPESAAPRTPYTALDAVQMILAAAALFLCLRAVPNTPCWILLALALPCLRLMIVSSYRRRVLVWLRELWGTLESYPSRTTRVPWRAAFVFVVAPAVILMLSREFAVSSGDSAPVMMTAAHLLTAGNFDLTDYVETYRTGRLFTRGDEQPYYFRREATGAYSSYPSGMVPFALPTAAAAHLLGADLRDPAVLLRLDHWTAAWVSAASLGLFFLLALHLAPPKPALAAVLLLAVGSAMYSTIGQSLFQHGGVLFWGLTALFVEFRRLTRPSLAGAALQGVALAMMASCRLTSSLFIAPFGVWVLCRSPRHVLRMAGFACLAYLPWAWFYSALYGSPFGPSMSQTAGGNWSVQSLGSGAAGVLVSPSHGILVYQPWFLFAGFALIPAFRRRIEQACRAPCPKGWALFALCYLVLHLSLISAWRCWWGGYCWGSRLAAEVTPFVALVCVGPIAMLWTKAVGRRLVWAAVVLGALLHLPAVYLREVGWSAFVDLEHHPEKLWSWSDPPFASAVLHGRHVADDK
jgi:hypothetical protein